MNNDKSKKTDVEQPLGDAINALVQGIKKLEQENASYADIRAKEAELEEKETELLKRELDLKRLERDMRAHPEKYIFNGINPQLWEVKWHVAQPPETKCTECDENGYRHYTSPNGAHVKERCRCRWERREYIIGRARLFEIRLPAGMEPVLFYRPEEADDDSFSTIRLDHDHCVYDGKQPFGELNRFRVLFRDEVAAREYAEWLNKNEKPHHPNREIRYEDQ